MLSSCVPSAEMETSGARIGAGEFARFRGHPKALGLAEMMNYPGVAAGDAECLAKGMRVLIREGSVSKDLAALTELTTERLSPYLGFCTDDRNPLDIGEEGHLDHMIRAAIAAGIDPVVAYRVASLSGAEAHGLRDRGQIAPGRRADIVALGSLEACDARAVWAGGVELTEAAFEERAAAEIGRRSVRVPQIGAARFWPSWRCRWPG